MHIRKFMIKSAMGAAMAIAASSVLAQSQPLPEVSMRVEATMPTIKDPKATDLFAVSLVDAQVSTRLDIRCSAGHSELVFLRSDKACSVGGNGAILNPSTKAELPRTQYLGQYTVTKDGLTDAKTLMLNYLAVGKVAPSSSQFGGSLNLKPELTSTGAKDLTDAILKKIGVGSEGPVTDAVDTVDLNGLFVPSAGMPSDKGCTWDGNMVFAYQTYSWFMDLKATCGTGSYVLKGNMPFIGEAGVEGTTTYQLTLTVPSAEISGDDALFVSSDANADLFAQASGISGTLTMTNSAIVTATVDGESFDTPSRVVAEGKFVGTDVPLDVVRSFSTLIGILPSTFFGA